jgi:hypothetical protein
MEDRQTSILLPKNRYDQVSRESCVSDRYYIYLVVVVFGGVMVIVLAIGPKVRRFKLS